jgi:ubiquitin C-terminal hydrolase
MEKCGYRCENKKCKAVDKMDKDITIFRFPKILVIHLKRFSRREKITTAISIPKTLDMTPFAPHSGKLISKLEHPSKQRAVKYRFYGMSMHSGSLHGGHYVADVMDVDTKDWFHCNDSTVSRASFQKSSSSAYVLFFA